MEERRKSPRRTVQDGIAILPTTTNVQLLDVSVAGVLLQSDQIVDVGSEGSLSLTLDGATFRASVHVQRVAAKGLEDGWHLGARFVALSPDDRRLIARFMAP